MEIVLLVSRAPGAGRR